MCVLMVRHCAIPVCGAGTEARRLENLLGPGFIHQDNSPWDIFVDWVEPYNSVAYSCGVIGLRAADVSERHKGSAGMSRILAIIPGPKAPENAAVYLKKTLDAFQRLAGPGAKGIRVTERYTNADGVVVERTFFHRPYLTGFFADSPARSGFRTLLQVPRATTGIQMDHPPSLFVSDERKVYNVIRNTCIS